MTTVVGRIRSRFGAGERRKMGAAVPQHEARCRKRGSFGRGVSDPHRPGLGFGGRGSRSRSGPSILQRRSRLAGLELFSKLPFGGALRGWASRSFGALWILKATAGGSAPKSRESGPRRQYGAGFAVERLDIRRREAMRRRFGAIVIAIGAIALGSAGCASDTSGERWRCGWIRVLEREASSMTVRSGMDRRSRRRPSRISRRFISTSTRVRSGAIVLECCATMRPSIKAECGLGPAHRRGQHRRARQRGVQPRAR